jgi:hypothetical protein
MITRTRSRYLNSSSVRGIVNLVAVIFDNEMVVVWFGAGLVALVTAFALVSILSSKQRRALKRVSNATAAHVVSRMPEYLTDYAEAGSSAQSTIESNTAVVN